MHSVSSNAVANLFSANIDNTKFTLTTTNQQAQYTGLLYCVIQQNTTNNVIIYEDDAELLVDDRGGEYSYNHSFTVLIRKGHRYKYNIGTMAKSNFIPFF